MPELPEVETVRRGLQKYVVGHTIESVDEINPGIIQGDLSDVLGQKIVSARRIGKGLILDLENGYSLGIHIKLTGQLIFRDENLKNEPFSKDKVGSIPNKFTHVIFTLDQSAKLYYNDQRRFGWIKIVRSNDLMNLPFFKNMGPEPFKDLTLEKFEEIVLTKQTKIKPLLMDQEMIGGIGNIYANDALFRAKIDPRRPAKSLTPQETKDLFDSIIAVMEKSFEEGGASELSFVNILGQEGGYQRHSLVYGKTKKPCPICGNKIQRLTIAGRGTFYCSNCQA
ncbi:MAG: bifunctional DNA-formamidopyrimidine glycosylase/DNA-(apurinic or apyrimidinic site) lyase [Candidatus Levybacteria bacterium]|nr:bifunctional DNA-formamidopyrimidine glycosylase/DNA-(apurinic or apyrimidinic site) lyase [Candidatus Levybacteria bacterium]